MISKYLLHIADANVLYCIQNLIFKNTFSLIHAINKYIPLLLTNILSYSFCVKFAFLGFNEFL